ncbi:MAG: AAA family ATPase, partial [Lachnospiraceae bacterium]|nr:AAA family ATPase [Lachnospiraceae bacterium]
MYIKKLYLRHFGKYHKRELELQKGINLIYGPNEAGKTTIKDFIIGMFYGVERLRGIAARTDEYTRHEPFDSSGYSGSMELEQEGKAYLIDRSFRKDQKSLKVYQQDTGRELDTGEGPGLPEIIADMDKNGYINTLCISSHGATYGQDLQEEFRQYMMNINATKAGNLNLKDAYNYLNSQKKALNRKGLESELQSLSRRMTEVHLEEGLEQIGR